MSESETVKNLPNEEGVDALTELALNLHWSWNHAADELWTDLDADLCASFPTIPTHLCRSKRGKSCGSADLLHGRQVPCRLS